MKSNCPKFFPLQAVPGYPCPISKEIVTVSPQFLQLLLRIKRYNEEKVKKLFEKIFLFLRGSIVVANKVPIRSNINSAE